MNLSKAVKSGCRYLADSNYRFLINASLGKYDSIPDDEYLKRKFKSIMGYELNLDEPRTFNEKLQWLKLYNRRPEYTTLVDKYLVRNYIEKSIGEQYLIPLLGVWNDPDEIDFESLPERFVLKCNHNSGLGMCICKDKSKLDISKVKANLRKGLKQDYYLTGREWPYKDVPRKIICEKYMQDSLSDNLNDYKIMCFNGQAKCSFVCSDRFGEQGLRVTFYDLNWNLMPFERHYPKSQKVIEKPKSFEKMIKLAEILSTDIPFVRVDFYEVDGKVYFGELTFSPGSGFEEFSPEAWDYKLGELIELPRKSVL